MANLTTKPLTDEQEKQVQEYIKQGQTRETAIRIVLARPATSTAKGSLNTCNHGFSLLK